MATQPQTNFAHLEQHHEQLLRLGMLPEKYFAKDPSTCLLKLRQLSKLLAQLLAAEETQYDLLRRIQDSGVLSGEIFQLFGEARRTGNEANHALEGDPSARAKSTRSTPQLTAKQQ